MGASRRGFSGFGAAPFRHSVLGILMIASACTSGGGATGPASSQVPSPTGTGGSSPIPSPAAPHLQDPVGIAFDSSGDMWVANYEGPTLVMYPSRAVSRALGGGGVHSPASLRPAVVISASVGPNQLTFGPDGRLWVAGYDANVVAGYDPRQLRASGSPRPAVMIRSRAGSLSNPSDVAFDGRGNLWVSNEGSGDVVELAASDLHRSGAPHPVVRLHTRGDAQNCQALAFSPDGHLWVARYGEDRILGFSPRELTRSGAPRPAIAVHTGTFTGPIGLAFDPEGRLWTSLANDSSVAAFRQPLHSGSSPPVVSLSGGGMNEPHSVTFDRHGNLWVTSHNDTLLEYDRRQLSMRSVSRPNLVVA